MNTPAPPVVSLGPGERPDVLVDAAGTAHIVFNERWEVVALHHYWVAAPAGDSINYRNQGRRIDRVAERMQLHGVTVAG